LCIEKNVAAGSLTFGRSVGCAVAKRWVDVLGAFQATMPVLMHMDGTLAKARVRPISFRREA